MHCKHCQKEEETIKIAGKTYCTNCSTLLLTEKVADKDTPSHKIPVISLDNNEIRTAKPKSHPMEVSPDAKEISHDIDLPAKTADELGESAILLDIISDDAKELQDEKTLKQDKALEEASGAVLDTINQRTNTESQVEGVATSRLQEKIVSLDKELEPTLSEEGATTEYDMLIILSGFVVILIILIVLMFAFKQYI